MHRSRTGSGAAPSTHYTHSHHTRSSYTASSHPPSTTREVALSNGNNKPQECHICLEDLRTDLVACPCGHVYHDECITQALSVDRQCPVCRGRATPNQLIRLFLEVPESSTPSTADLLAQARGSHDPQVAALNERLAIVIERLQFQKKQYDVVVAEVKRSRHQAEQLLVDKQTLLHRVSALEANKQELLSKVAKYQIELSRQAEAARQTAVNQSVLNYLNSCDAEVLEEEVQNPRELVAALKKACKFRHDQYQKVVKEKMKLKSMVQSLQQQLGSGGGANVQEFDQDSRLGKNKMKSPMEPKRTYSATEYSTPHHLETKKRKINISPAAVSSNSQAQPSPSPSVSAIANFGARGETSTFRSNAYTDVVGRSLTYTNMQRSQNGFSRSSFNPNQYGSYNLVPSHQPPVQVSDHAVCRRGYDETGKLTNYFIPKETKRPSQSSMHSHKNNTSSYQYSGSASTNNRNSVATSGSSCQTGGERRDYPLTNWLRKGQ